MPRWVKHALWILASLILLASWRQVGRFLAELVRSVAAAFHQALFGWDDPLYRFVVFGLVLVVCLGAWRIWCDSRARRDH